MLALGAVTALAMGLPEIVNSKTLTTPPRCNFDTLNVQCTRPSDCTDYCVHSCGVLCDGDSWCKDNGFCHFGARTPILASPPSPPPAPPSSPCEAISDCTEKGTLYILLQNGHAKLQEFADFGGLPRNIAKHFSKVAIVVSNSINPVLHNGTWKAPCAGSACYVDELAQWRSVEKALVAAGFPVSETTIERHLELYFGEDGFEILRQCNAALYDKNSQAQCTNNVQAYARMYEGANIAGFMFDDEEGDSLRIVAAMEALRLSSRVQIGWSKELSSMKLASPRSYGKLLWDYSLGQAYTDDTQGFYSRGGCDIANASSFWSRDKSLGVFGRAFSEYDAYPPAGAPGSKKQWDAHVAPLLCMGGNCQEPPVGYEPTPGQKCFDERLSASVVETLFDARPASLPWKSAGLWFGKTVAEMSICAGEAKGRKAYECKLDAAEMQQCSQSIPWQATVPHNVCA